MNDLRRNLVCAIVSLLITSSARAGTTASARATALEAIQTAYSLKLGPRTESLPLPVETTIAHMPAATSDTLQYRGTATNNLGAFTININPGPTLAANGPALAAFGRAAQQWTNFIADPISVNIDADLAPLGVGIIGSNSSVVLTSSYTSIRNAMAADSADEGDDGIVASLPGVDQFSAVVPAGFSLGGMSAAKANLKALGFADLDILFGSTDATITFSTAFPFDFDNNDGVSAGTLDFETVAVHEIGHALGFTSEVDWADFVLSQGLTDTLYPTPLDLFRFQNDVPGGDPTTAAEFTTFPRFLTTGNDAITDQIFPVHGVAAEIRMSTGEFTGDGNQASHWKADELTGALIGIMDPTLGFMQFHPITNSDLRSLDLIGYEINVPEPSTFVLMAVGLGCLRWRPRHRT